VNGCLAVAPRRSGILFLMVAPRCFLRGRSPETSFTTILLWLARVFTLCFVYVFLLAGRFNLFPPVAPQHPPIFSLALKLRVKSKVLFGVKAVRCLGVKSLLFSPFSPRVKYGGLASSRLGFRWGFRFRVKSKLSFKCLVFVKAEVTNAVK